MEKSRVNISEAARLVQKDRKTLQRHMKEGKSGKGTLSFHTDEDGRKLIDVAELQRFYGDLKLDAAPEPGNNGESPQHVAGKTADFLRQRVDDLERVNEELRKDKEDLKKDKDDFKIIVKGMQEELKEQRKYLLAPPEDKQESKSTKPKQVTVSVVDEEKSEPQKSQKNVPPKAAPTASQARKKKKESKPKKKGFFSGIFGGK